MDDVTSSGAEASAENAEEAVNAAEGAVEGAAEAAEGAAQAAGEAMIAEQLAAQASEQRNERVALNRQLVEADENLENFHKDMHLVFRKRCASDRIAALQHFQKEAHKPLFSVVQKYH